MLMTETAEKTIMETDLPGAVTSRSGKVRDIYDYGDGLLLVATDRISAFDAVMANGIPGKGKILTQLSVFWFDMLEDIIPNHLLSTEISDFPQAVSAYGELLDQRAMWCEKADVIRVEAIVRGYLAGSAWRAYKDDGVLCGKKLPEGLVQAGKLPEPIFTPTEKAETGHDEELTPEQVVDEIGAERAEQVEQTAIELYETASEYAASRGFIIADTKFEFGIVDGEMILIDEVLTPDSSRYWDIDMYEPGRSQQAFDKQYVRDYLETLDWDREPPGPQLPDDVVGRTREIYLDTLQRLTGELL